MSRARAGLLAMSGRFPEARELLKGRLDNIGDEAIRMKAQLEGEEAAPASP